MAILAATIILYSAVVRDPSIERCIHLNQEVALLLAHALILAFHDRTDIHVPCKLVSAALQSLFLSVFSFMAIEAFQAYTIGSSVLGKGGLMNRKQLTVLGWALPAVYAGASALVLHDRYTSAFSCWLNLGHGVAIATIAPVLVLAGATIVMVEAAGMDAGFQPQTDQCENQAFASLANQKGLLFVLPANVGSWFAGLYAVYEANIALYGIVFALNLTLAVAIFAFHTLGNPKVSYSMGSESAMGQ